MSRDPESDEPRSHQLLVIGGARSGKSRYAQSLALSLSDSPLYVATSRIWDDGHRRRIERHQRERDSRFETLECETRLHELPLSGRVVVIDCLTLWLCNLLDDEGGQADACEARASATLERLKACDARLIVVTNEVGQGVVPTTELGSRFRDLQGTVNQRAAQLSDAVALMVAGIPHYVKGEAPSGG